MTIHQTIPKQTSRADAPAPESPEEVFLTNLHAFGGRAARLAALARAGSLSPDSCFVALTHLWIQLAHAHRGLANELPVQRTRGGYPKDGRD